LNTTVVTGKKVQSGAANADLARAGGGVRWAVMEEPGGDEMINDGILNNLSGNDTFYARDLFEKGKDGREITPMFKLIFICNKLPKLRYNLKATWNRLRVVPFESVFVRPGDPEGVPDTYEEQLRQKRFPMDKNFSQKIPGMLEAFAWVLLEHRKTIKDRIEPEKVRIATETYRRQNDNLREFFVESIIEDKKSEITVTELYATFKEWYRESMPNHTLPIKKEVEEYFTKMWDEPGKGKKWKGFRVRTLQDDVDDGNIVILDDEDLVDYEEGQKNLPKLMFVNILIY
jgi:phage/plasmid-associated DNA primase